MIFSSNDWLSHTLPRVQIKERSEILLGSANAIGQVSLEYLIAGQPVAGLITPDSRRFENILETMEPIKRKRSEESLQSGNGPKRRRKSFDDDMMSTPLIQDVPGQIGGKTLDDNIDESMDSLRRKTSVTNHSLPRQCSPERCMTMSSSPYSACRGRDEHIENEMSNQDQTQERTEVRSSERDLPDPSLRTPRISLGFISHGISNGDEAGKSLPPPKDHISTIRNGLEWDDDDRSYTMRSPSPVSDAENYQSHINHLLSYMEK